MASDRLIKRRIKSAKNIAQITRAMQLVAASKMKKAQSKALAGRPYTEKIAEMVHKFVKKIDQEKHPLLQTNNSQNNLIIVISTNKGLCGGLNATLFRQLLRWFTEVELGNSNFISLGKKGEHFLARSNKSLVADFSDQVPFTIHIPALTKLVTGGYIKGQYKAVYLVYNNFISALHQEPIRKRILPITEFLSQEDVKDSPGNEEEQEFLVEPDINEILDPLLFHYLENQIRDAVLEAEASEQSARMMAMKNATDNASELIELLTLEYNKARQEKITYEIADIVTARLAIQ